MSCPRFVQNAWKRDLCSNCFKGKEEHAPVVDNRARYLASLKDLSLRPPPPGILKGLTKKNVAAFKVHFPAEESQVIGYGGEDFSDLEDEEEAPLVRRNGKREDSPSEDSPEEEEDYRNFQKLTDSNTEFNKDPANLLGNKPANEKPANQAKKVTTAPLKLGQVQSNGKKSTILVSVQPFGSAANSTPLAVSRKTHLNNLLHDATDSLKLSDNVEVKNNLPSVTIKTDIVNDNKTELDFDKDSNSKIINDTGLVTVNNGVVENSLVSIVDNVNEDFEIKPEEDESYKKTEKAEDRLSSLIEGKKSQITRGTMLTKSHEQKTKRYFQLGPVKPDEESPISESVMKKLEAKERSLHNSFSKAKDTISIKSIQQKNIKNTANGLFSSRLLKKEFGIQSDLQLTKMKPLDYIDSNLSAIEPNVEKEPDKKSNETNEVSIISFKKLAPEDVLEKDGLLLIDGVPAESREMAGEPDGRADSDDLDEPPPDLPTTPPPNLTDHIPRPSFLHSVAKEKPKLPVKPKLREKSPPKELVLDHVQLDDTPCDPSLSPDSCRSLITKRQAPKPPPTPLGESPPKYSPTEGSPVERRERASSCSPLPSDSSSNSSQTPEPPTRRSLSLSHETLASNGTPFPVVLDKKKGNKMRSTIRKFLRLASREEFKCEELGAPPLPPPRPRPEIIHPLDLNKSAVQVLRSDGTPVLVKPSSSVPESPSSPTTPTGTGFYSRPNKPPPPPRSQSLDSALGLDTRPVRPPPPNKQLLTSTTSQTATPTPTPTTNGHSVYVNLGEVRSAIAPAKPQRTASLREKENSEPIYQTTSALQMTENLYESLAPECDLSRERSSLPYYGSETESDIYCPYTFANSHKQGDELRPCKSRSVVHKSLEDNYGAVVVANHEALTQLLEQMSTRPIAPPGVRALRANSSLQWTDFTVEGGAGGEMEVAGRVFLSASYGPHPLTLCLTPGQARLPPCLAPVTQFFDLVASQFLHQEKTELVQVSVAVLARQEFLSLASFCKQLAHDQTPDAAREAALLLVQIVNSLKCLQAQGREEASLSHFVLSRDDKRTSPRICLLSHDSAQDENQSLCQCALKAAESLCLPAPLMDMLRSVLGEERATSLTQAKATLELWLWGPTHIPVSPDKQTSLQRWLDLERATVLHSLVVRRPLTLSCGDFCHLSFLVQTNAKVMSDALELLDRHTSSSPSS